MLYPCVGERLPVSADTPEKGTSFVFEVLNGKGGFRECFSETGVASFDHLQPHGHDFSTSDAQHGVNSAIRGAHNSVEPPQQSFSRNNVSSRRPSRSAL
jgi:hypothetical protein